MKNLHNIEKSAFRPGQYVGYAYGVWSIARAGKTWRAVHRDDTWRPVQCADTLAELSLKLAAQPAPPSSSLLPVVSI